MATQPREILLREVGRVLSSLRENARFSGAFPGHYRSTPESPLVKGLKNLRAQIRSCRDDRALASLSALDCVRPFLSVIVSPLTNGSHTGVALRSILSFIRLGILNPDTPNAREAIVEVVEMVVNARFEETDRLHDQSAWLLVMQVMVEAIEADVGVLLPDDSLWDVIEVCYNLLDDPARLEVTNHAAQDALFRLVKVVFETVPTLTSPSRLPSLSSSSAAAAADPTLNAYASAPGAVPSQSSSLSMLSPPVSSASSPGVPGEPSAAMAMVGSGKVHGSRNHGLVCAVKLFRFLCAVLAEGNNRSRARTASVGPASGGLSPPPPSSHSGSLSLEEEDEDERRDLCLKLLGHAIVVAGPSLELYPPLLELVKDNLCHALLELGKGGHAPATLAEVLCVVRCLWATMRGCLKMQFEVLFNGIFLRLLSQLQLACEEEQWEVGLGLDDGLATAKRRAIAGSLQQYSDEEAVVVLEALCDFLSDPTVLVELLINYDCDFRSSNLMEGLVSGLCLCAQSSSLHRPENRQRCLEAVLIVLRAMEDTVGMVRDGNGDDDGDGGSGDEGGGVMDRLRQGGCGSSGAAVGDGGTRDSWSKRRSVREAYLNAWHDNRMMAMAAEEFQEKPSKGLKMLQRQGMLPQPLTAQAVAAFLRSAPSLSKPAIGSYLGESGKDSVDGVYEGDTRGFHEQVLEAYVSSFDFQGQPLLTSLRMFLTAFRLPGEAQQIDRILQAFSNHVYTACLEGQQGALATSDVAYLLSFSIIMLNTDLHNPNIRQEKRMSLEAFIMNNSNYGEDISRGKDLPREMLEHIYGSIQQQQIITLDDGPAGEVTLDRWRDLLRQALGDPEQGTLRTFSSLFVEPSPVTASSPLPSSSLSVSSSTSLSYAAASCAAMYHRDILQLTWQKLLRAASPAFAAGASSVTEVLSQCVDITLTVAKLASRYEMRDVLNAVVFLLCEFTGLLKGSPLWSSLNGVVYNRRASTSFSSSSFGGVNGGTAANGPPAGPGLPPRPSAAPPSAYDRMDDVTQTLETLAGSPSAQAAVVTSFGIAHKLGRHLGAMGWQLIFRVILRLRDIHLLPREMLRESDEDLITPEARAHFTAGVLAAQGMVRGVGRHRAGGLTDGGQSSLLKWVLRRQSTEVGGGTVGGGSGSVIDAASSAAAIAMELHSRAELWDGECPYSADEDVEVAAVPSIPRQQTSEAESRPRSEGIAISLSASEEGTDISQHSELGDREMRREPPLAMGEVMTRSASTGSLVQSVPSRQMVATKAAWLMARSCATQCKVQDLMTESRFLGTDSLQQLVRGLIVTIHCSLPPYERDGKHEMGGVVGSDLRQSISLFFKQPDVDDEDGRNDSSSGAAIGGEGSSSLYPGDALSTHHISRPSLAFAEVLLAELAVRNRDRCQQLCPLLLEHYRVRLGNASALTFSVEKAATGLIRLVTRLFSRAGPDLSRRLLEGLTWLFPPHADARVSEALTGHIGAGLRRLVASNMDVLESVLSQCAASWNYLLGAIRSCAAFGGEGPVLAFESLCLLVHDRQLRYSIPATACTDCMLKFAKGHRHDVSYSVAALDLAMVMHARLKDVVESYAAKEEADNGDGSACASPQAHTDGLENGGFDGREASSTGGVVAQEIYFYNPMWRSYWLPVMNVFARGVDDDRADVKAHACKLLKDALLHEYCVNAPPRLLLQLLVDTVFAAATSAMGQELPTPSMGALGDPRQTGVGEAATQVSRESSGGSAVSQDGGGGGEESDYEMVEVVEEGEDRGRSVADGGAETAAALRGLTPTPEEVEERVSGLMLLSDVYSHVLPCIVHLPAFHEVWVQVLNILQVPLMSPGDEIVGVVAHELVRLVRAMVAEGAFEGGHDTVGLELWELTWLVVEDFTAVPRLLADAFPGTSPTKPPAPDPNP